MIFRPYKYSLDRSCPYFSANEKYLPRNFLDFVASQGLSVYVNGLLARGRISFDAEMATRVALEKTLYHEEWNSVNALINQDDFGLDFLEALTSLVQLGADPNAGPSGYSILQSMMTCIYQNRIETKRAGPKVIYERKHRVKASSQALVSLLDAGADLYPCINLIIRFSAVKRALMEFHTSLAPLSDSDFEHQDSSYVLRYRRSLRYPIPITRPSRIRFIDDGDARFWAPGGQLMKSEHSISMHSAVARLISCSDEDFKHRYQELESVCQTLQKDYWPLRR